MTGINPRSPLPKYSQLRTILLELLETELSPGDPIPSERELKERFGLSRMTVRKAVDQLVAEGMLHRVLGRGTYVSEVRTDVPLALSSFTEDMVARGLRPTQRTLLLEERPATAHLADRLGLATGAPLYLLRRLRYANDRVVCLENAYLPAELVPGLRDNWDNGSLYATLDAHYDLRPTWSEQRIGAAAATEESADALDVAPGAPLLTVRQIAYHRERPVEYCVSSYRPDRYELWVTLNSPAPDPGPPNAQATSRPTPVPRPVNGGA